MFGIFLHSIVFAYLALGILYTERIGLLNISVEGISFLSVFLTSLFIYLGYGIVASVIITIFISLIFGFFLSFLVKNGYNIFITGIGINMFCYFLVRVLMKANFNFILGFSLNIANNLAIIFFVLFFFVFLTFSIYIMNYSKVRVVFEFIRLNDCENMLGEQTSNYFKSFAIFVSLISASISGSFLAINFDVYSYDLGLNNGWFAICILYIAFTNAWLILPSAFMMIFIEYKFFNFQDYVNSYFALSLPFYAAILINVFLSFFRKTKLF
ncbi:ABC transporter permease [Borrelia coriaceae]|uniref:Nucleoside transport system permease protein n=1 Tax=Borrelia coriaceae ATCC 43381 TaxID=1408429 RepID=W5SU93_9SPIR|nr:membrane protein [Borrelia coriaceae]AHH10485.1 Nucleoside transport system permease protein [Borrelia coriaceae ATCC 43381]UPA16187.1 ABC transporter permease [Borrelia coriaceae]